MSCALTAGYSIPCGQLVGGIKAAYMSEDQAVDIPALAGFAASSSSITAVTSGTAVEFWEFELKKELSTFTNTTTREPANGTVFESQSATLVFHGDATRNYETFHKLATGRRNVWILDNQNQLFLLGATQGMDVTSVAFEPGTSYGDMVGYRMELTGSEPALYFGAAGTAADPFNGITGVSIN